MKSRIAPIFLVFTSLLIASCGDEQSSTNAALESADVKKSSVFGSALDKAKANREAANDRQMRMEAALGYDSSAETHTTLGMTETSQRPGADDSVEGEGMFGDMHTSMNKAKATQDMLNDRQRQLDALSGGEY